MCYLMLPAVDHSVSVSVICVDLFESITPPPSPCSGFPLALVLVLSFKALVPCLIDERLRRGQGPKGKRGGTGGGSNEKAGG